MDYDWRGFIFLFAALLIFIAIVMMIAGVVILIRRYLEQRKGRR